MNAQPQKNNDKSANVKNAAELLVKGASLISDACNICKGVQIKFKDLILREFVLEANGQQRFLRLASPRSLRTRPPLQTLTYLVSRMFPM